MNGAEIFQGLFYFFVAWLLLAYYTKRAKNFDQLNDKAKLFIEKNERPVKALSYIFIFIGISFLITAFID